MDSAKLDDLTKWAFDFCVSNEDKGEKTGGFHLTMVDMVLSQGVASQREDATKAYPFFESLFAKRQQANGAWKEGNQVKIAGAEKEAEEVDTMWTLLGIRTLERLGDKLPAETRKALAAEREKATAYLKDAKPGKRIDWLALRMLVAREAGAKDRAAELLEELRDQQNADGGWGFIRGGTSYPHTTGECLYALSVAGVGGDDPAMQEGDEVSRRFTTAERFVEGNKPERNSARSRIKSTTSRSTGARPGRPSGCCGRYLWGSELRYHFSRHISTPVNTTAGSSFSANTGASAFSRNMSRSRWATM